MFLGHFAAGMALKRAHPRLSLGMLFAAAQMQDLLWPLLLLLGVEHVRIDPGNTAVTPLDFEHYPYTHSLAGAVAIAACLGAVYAIFRRDARAGLVLFTASFSHWVLDFVTHRPDLPLAFGGETYFGLGLWNSVPGTVAVEGALFGGSLFLYARGTGARSRRGRYGLAALAVLLVLIYAANLLGPPPPDEAAIAIAGNAMWLFVLAAWWVDRSRDPAPDRFQDSGSQDAGR